MTAMSTFRVQAAHQVPVEHVCCTTKSKTIAMKLEGLRSEYDLMLTTSPKL